MKFAEEKLKKIFLWLQSLITVRSQEAQTYNRWSGV